MDSFKEYIYEKEDKKISKEMLNEDTAAVAAIILGAPTVGFVAAYGGAQILFALSKGIKGIIKNWKMALSEFASVKDVANADVKHFVYRVQNDPMAKKVFADEKQNMREYEEVLKDVYAAIGRREFSKENNKVAEEFKKIPKNLQNSPDVKRAVINEIIKTTGEPPIWPPSPGNVTYQAIKYSIGIREAKAQATAFKYNAIKTLKNMDE